MSFKNDAFDLFIFSFFSVVNVENLGFFTFGFYVSQARTLHCDVDGKLNQNRQPAGILSHSSFYIVSLSNTLEATFLFSFSARFLTILLTLSPITSSPEQPVSFFCCVSVIELQRKCQNNKERFSIRQL